MQDELDRITQKLQELLDEIQRVPEKLLRDTQRKLFEQAGTDFASFSGLGRQVGIDPYRILGLEKSASDEDVKKRFHQRVRQFHPDTAGPGFEYHFQSVLVAFQLISKERGWQ